MIVYLICYLASFLFARVQFYYPSGLVLMAAAVWLYVSDYRKSRNLIHLRGLFSLFWVGGQGIACLKLSELQTDWTIVTWICFALALIGFWGTFEVLSRYFGDGHDSSFGRRRRFRANPKPIMACMVIVTALSLSAFLYEAYRLEFIPLLVRGVPHAYSEFHVTGVHYFTVSCVLVPALSVLYIYARTGNHGSLSLGNWGSVIVINFVALLIPLLCVSRFQIIFAVVLAMFVLILLLQDARESRMLLFGIIGIAFVLLVAAYLMLSVARSHDVEYLNGIFEMKNRNMPIFITQPYMYIANNYENFNCLVEALPKFSLGIRGLFPLWALTGLKFLVPSLIYYPIYVNKEELTTLTMFYDSYYDFGIPGVLVFSCALGVVAYVLAIKIKELDNPMGYLVYAQIAIYLMLSFFTTWFSNPTTWFYLIATGMMAIFYQLLSHWR